MTNNKSKSKSSKKGGNSGKKKKTSQGPPLNAKIAYMSHAPRGSNPRNPNGRMTRQELSSNKVNTIGAKVHSHHTCALTNPFCPAAKGYRFPDGNGQNTIGQQFRGRQTLTGTTSGYTTGAAMIFFASAPYGYTQCTYSAAWQIPSAMSEYLGNSVFATACSTYRIVSFGVIIRVASSTQYTSGVMSLNTIAPNGLLGGSLTTSSADYMEQRNFPLATGAEYTWVSKPTGSDSTRFQALTATSTNSSTGGWTSLMVEITSSSSTTALDIEYYLNVEGEISPNQPLAHLAPPPAPPNLLAIKGSKTIQQKMDSSHAGGVDVFDSFIKEMALPVMKDLVANVSPEMIMSALSFI
jgi:hypothetical protein